MDKLEGRRILHIMSPVRFDGNKFNHESDSNFNTMMKITRWLPKCHHYILVPPVNNIPDTQKNVTLLKYDYPHNAVSNRSMFNGKELLKLLDFTKIDVDFIFTHQPELLYNVLVAMMDKRYGEITSRFSFYHWIDCSASRGSPAIPHSYMRQLEAVNLSDKIFLHTPVSVDYMESNFKQDKSVSFNRKYVESKTVYMPTSAGDKTDVQEFPLPNTKKPMFVFNHRWKQSTGMNRFLEYTKDLTDKYLFVITDSDAENVPDGYYVMPEFLNSKQYRYLLKKSHGTLCFVDGYATWNLSVQDHLSSGTTCIAYNHPILKHIFPGGANLTWQTATFKNKEDFEERLQWASKIEIDEPMESPDHDATFKHNLIGAMGECIQTTKNTPKDAPAWVYYILNNIQFKADIANQVQPNIKLNSVWQYIRRWLLTNGVKDDYNSPYTRYSIDKSERKQLEALTKDLNLKIKPQTNKQTMIVPKHEFF